MRELRALWVGWCVCLVGCVEPIDVSGELAELEVLRVETREGLGGAEDTQVALIYQMRDLEGDDQNIKVEVCEMIRNDEPIPGSDQIRYVYKESECGFPIQGPLSDGTVAVPTAPRRTPTTHVFIWDLACGRLASAPGTPTDAVILPTRLLEETVTPPVPASRGYRFKIRVPGRSFDTSETFMLPAQDVTLGECE